MKVLQDHQATNINKIIVDNLEETSIVFSDKSTSYVDIANYVEVHITEKSDANTTKTTLQWVRIAISNANLKDMQLFLFHFLSVSVLGAGFLSLHTTFSLT